MVQFTITNDAGTILCRLTLAPTATLHQLTLQVYLVKPELQRTTCVIRNNARHTACSVSAPSMSTQTLLQAGLTAESSTAETLIFSSSSADVSPMPPSTTASASSVESRILELFGNSGAPSASPPAVSAAAAPAVSGGFVDPALIDPAQAELQRRIYEQIQQQQIDENLANALEYTPEAFARVTMLFVPCVINRVPIKAFIDSGAQMSIMNQATAEKCGLMRLVDRRMRGIAVGVGRQEIIGRIHMTPVNIAGEHIPFSFSVIADQSIDLIIGLDQLRRHQMVIDLKNNCLVIDAISVPFLPEGEIPKSSHDEVNEEDEQQQQLEQAEGGDVSAGMRGAEEDSARPRPPLPPPSQQQLQQQQREPFLSSPASPAAAAQSASAAGGAVPMSRPPAPTASEVTSPASPNSSSASPEAQSVLPHNEADRAVRVDTFMAFTGITDRTQATELLEAVEWDPDAAAALYFEDA